MTSIDDLFNDLQSKMDAHSRRIDEVQNTREGHSLNSNNTHRLEGKDLNTVRSELRAGIQAHINSLGNNIHNLTAEELGSVSGNVMRFEIDSLMDSHSRLPISFYGERNYLPAPLFNNHRNMVDNGRIGSPVHLMENNGMWVCLANTTDGSYDGVSILYSPNMSLSNGTDMIRSSIPYEPSYMARDEYALYVVGDETSFFLYCSKKNDHVVSSVYYVITNGTLDPNHHLAINVTNKFRILKDRELMCSYRYNNSIYLFITNDTYMISYDVYTIDLRDVNNGIISFIKLSSWDNIRPGSSTLNSGQIRVAASINDVVVNNSTNIRIEHDYRTPVSKPLVVPTDVDGELYIVSSTELIIYDQLGVAQVDVKRFYVYSKINLDEQEVVHEPIYGTNRVNFNYASGRITTNGKGIGKWDTSQNTINKDYKLRLGSIDSHLITKNNMLISICLYSGGTGTFNRIIVRKFPDEDTNLDIIKGVSVAIRENILEVEGNFPSALTAPMGPITALGDKAILAHDLDPNRQAVWCDIKNDLINHKYPSSTNKNLLGIKPDENRIPLGELNEGAPAIQMVMSEVRSNKTYSTHACIDRFVYKSGRLTVSPHVRATKISDDGSMQYLGPNVREHNFTYNRSTLTNQIRNRVSAMGRTPSPRLDIDVTLYVSKHIGQDQSYLVALVPTRNPRNSSSYQTSIYVARCVVTLSGDNVTNVNLVTGNDFKIDAANTFNDFTYDAPVVNSASRQMANGDIVVGLVTPIVNYADTQMAWAIMFYIRNGVPRFLDLSYSYNSILGLVSSFVNFPQKGMYYALSDSGNILNGEVEAYHWMKTMGHKICDTETPEGLKLYPIQEAILKGGDGTVVLLSCEVTNNWSLYVVSEVPCMINGDYGSIRKNIFSFDPQVDRWGEWNVWLHKSGSTFRYKFVKESDVQPDENHLYLGYIRTGGIYDGITEVQINKSIAIGPNRLSKWAAGSSFPVSEGLAYKSAKLNWV